MIKNIIFDMGQVLIKFDPDYFIDRVGVDSPIDKITLTREVFKSLEWSMMDRGTIDEKEALKRMYTRLPDHLKDVAIELTCDWPKMAPQIDGSYELIEELKNNGYKIYLLSNASVSQKDYWKDVPCSKFFDGTVVSSYIHLVKPQQEIYKHILDKYNLKAEESIFIDDSTLNVEGAVYCGMKGIVFHGDYQEVRDKLIDNGVNISRENRITIR